jgi:hypothetical protein
VVRDGAAYASWNGATGVASWRLSDGGVMPRSGFETKLALAPGTHSVSVTALDRGGAPLGTSATVAL